MSAGNEAVMPCPDVPRVLFVDDDESLLAVLRVALRKQAQSWEMRFACGGSEAIEIVDSWQPDVVVSDMRMPGIDGATLLGRIRDEFPDALRIALSGQAAGELNRRGEEIAHYWFDKPCGRERLIKAIDDWLAQR